ncbi:hypothetical protein Ancab_025251 [Ancistrocladus abbreviatus]
MEDYNTTTFPSKKYYDLNAYYRRQMEKEKKKGLKKVLQTEHTVFNDEEQRRLELQQERDKRKEQEVEALKYAMHGGMFSFCLYCMHICIVVTIIAQAMKEQALLREEMAYQYKLGNFEAAAAIQSLDPDAAM